MTTQKPKNVYVSKKRTVTTYSELWHGSKVLLKRAQDDPNGSYWLWMGSLAFSAFSAFSFEAYMNHIGPKLFTTWDHLETLSPEGKLDVLCEKLGIILPKDKSPRQTIHQLFRFRNKLVHGKTVSIKENTIWDTSTDLFKYMGERPLATWEKYCTEKNVIKVLQDMEALIRLIHGKAGPKDDPVFSFGFDLHSASAQQES